MTTIPENKNYDHFTPISGQGSAPQVNMRKRCNMAKALVVYGTRYGATANTAEVIADAPSQDGFERAKPKTSVERLGIHNCIISVASKPEIRRYRTAAQELSLLWQKRQNLGWWGRIGFDLRLNCTIGFSQYRCSIRQGF